MIRNASIAFDQICVQWNIKIHVKYYILNDNRLAIKSKSSQVNAVDWLTRQACIGRLFTCPIITGNGSKITESVISSRDRCVQYGTNDKIWSTVAELIVSRLSSINYG